MAKVFKGINLAAGFYTYGSNTDQLLEGNMTTQKYVVEQASNTVGTFGGIYGAAWAIGWEGGRLITSRPFYRKSIRPNLQDIFGLNRNEFEYCVTCGREGEWIYTGN